MLVPLHDSAMPPMLFILVALIISWLLLCGCFASSPAAAAAEAELEDVGFTSLKLVHRNALLPRRNQSRLDWLHAAASHDAQRRKALSPRKANVAVAQLTSAANLGSGQYLVQIQMGTPARTFYLVPDTGSDLLWANCRTPGLGPSNFSNRMRTPALTLTPTPTRPRHRQGSSDIPSRRNFGRRYLNATASRSFQPLPCSANQCFWVPAPAGATCQAQAEACLYEYNYSDGSDTYGIIARETVSLANGRPALRGVLFGCSVKSHLRSIPGGGQGVLGLGQGPMSLPSQLGQRYGYRFSYCLVAVDQFHVDTIRKFNYLVLGPRPASLGGLVGPMKSTPLYSNPQTSFYYVGVDAVFVDRRRLAVPRKAFRIQSDGSGGTVVDSGTTLTRLVDPAYDAVVAEMTARVDAIGLRRVRLRLQLQQPQFDLCVDTSAGKPRRLPSLSFRFTGGAVFRPSVGNFWIDVDDGVTCLGLQSSDISDGSVIGNMMQQNFLIEFDGRRKLLRFARSDCSRIR